jgi:uncharacterized membrane protein
MSELPLHPIAVHFPVVLAVLAPAFALALLVALLRRRPATGLAWLVAILFAGLAVSAFIASETGELDEERVEAITGEGPLERHEDAAELLLALSLAGAAIATAGGLAAASQGAARARLPLALVTFAAGGAVAFAAVRAGHSGGELVYVHGAALAHMKPGAVGGAPAPSATPEAREHGGDHDED